MRNYYELILCSAVSCLLICLFCAAVDMKQAKLAVCNSHLRELHRMMTAYANDNGVMPPVWEEKKPEWRFWSDYIDPSPRRNVIFSCPEDQRNAHMFEKADPLVQSMRMSAIASYGMNERMHTYNSKTRHATMYNFKNPQRLILFGDAKVPMLMVIQNPGTPRHNGLYHYITAAGGIRNLTARELGGFKNGKLQYKDEDWTPWK